jgi:hypothetical protein
VCTHRTFRTVYALSQRAGQTGPGLWDAFLSFFRRYDQGSSLLAFLQRFVFNTLLKNAFLLSLSL